MAEQYFYGYGRDIRLVERGSRVRVSQSVIELIDNENVAENNSEFYLIS